MRVAHSKALPNRHPWGHRPCLGQARAVLANDCVLPVSPKPEVRLRRLGPWEP